MTGTPTLGFCEERSRSASRRVLNAVAAADGADPLSFETPLYDAIDPDALDALFPSGSADATVEFTYRGYRVTVRGTGEVDLAALDE